VHVNEVTDQIIGAAIAVHRRLGPGLLESAYRACLQFEMVRHGLRVEAEKRMPVVYDGIELECGYRIDLLVEDAVVVELKAVEKLESVHTAQVLTYLKLSGHSIGLILNFTVRLLRDGIRRVVLGLRE
jgi:GxxExxY protein